MQEGDVNRRCLINGAQDENRSRLKGSDTGNTGRDIIVQRAVRAGEEAKFLAEVQDVRRKNGADD